MEEFAFKHIMVKDNHHGSLKVEALRRGLPSPLTEVAEYFSIENETGMFAFPRTLTFLGRRIEAFLVAATTFYLLGLVASLAMPKVSHKAQMRVLPSRIAGRNVNLRKIAQS